MVRGHAQRDRQSPNNIWNPKEIMPLPEKEEDDKGQMGRCVPRPMPRNIDLQDALEFLQTEMRDTWPDVPAWLKVCRNTVRVHHERVDR